MTIGILDDNPALCHVLETTLTLAGYAVSAHTDPLAFIETMQHNKIGDLEYIIVDFRLPGERTGVDIISDVQQTHPHLRALLISGDPLPQTTLNNLSHVAFCQKPFRLSTLLAAMSRL